MTSPGPSGEVAEEEAEVFPHGADVGCACRLQHVLPEEPSLFCSWVTSDNLNTPCVESLFLSVGESLNAFFKSLQVALCMK